MSSPSATASFPVTRRWSLIEPLERVGSLAVLIVLAPFLAFVSLAIAVLSRRSPLVAHLRVGQFGAPLWTLKFRTMWTQEGADRFPGGWIEYIVDESGPESKRSADPRVTSKLARFCRRFSIDELPQLFHVARGEMSLVAPRPLTAGELQKYYGSDAPEILSVKPGITGLWQVAGRSRLTYQQRREMDLYLVRNRSLGLYLTILWRTIPAVLRGEDGW